ncbi:hypothetical protein LCGC14_2008740 [marine sediment metagenome]|uniref:Uncharacterized protein n=1 Tax=marine sediment metagenome TaxID=412755 RepID=A0A0F9FNG2_9ZZZZ
MKKVTTAFMVAMTVCFIIVNMIQNHHIKCLLKTQNEIIGICEKQINTDNLIMGAIEKYHK